MRHLRPALVLALASAALSAHAAVIDFEDLAGTGQGDDYAQGYGQSVVSGGFLFVSDSLTSIGPAGSPEGANYTGSIALLDNALSGFIFMTQVGGGAFTLNRIDLANLYTAASGFGQGSTVTFAGILLDGGTVSQSFTLAGGDALQTFSFTGFTDVTAVGWDQSAPYSQFDNIVVNESAVPGPVAALPFALMALRRRKRA